MVGEKEVQTIYRDFKEPSCEEYLCLEGIICSESFKCLTEKKEAHCIFILQFILMLSIKMSLITLALALHITCDDDESSYWFEFYMFCATFIGILISSLSSAFTFGCLAFCSLSNVEGYAKYKIGILTTLYPILSYLLMLFNMVLNGMGRGDENVHNKDDNKKQESGNRKLEFYKLVPTYTRINPQERCFLKKYAAILFWYFTIAAYLFAKLSELRSQCGIIGALPAETSLCYSGVVMIILVITPIVAPYCRSEAFSESERTLF